MLNYTKSKLLLSCLIFASLVSVGQQAESVYTMNAVNLDGESNESDWELATWYTIDQVVLGNNLSPNDFSGKFKSIWDENYIYVLAEIIDDSLSDDHINPTDNYWNDDCIEIFIDENKTSETHQYNHKAFAYHVSTLGEVVDVGLNQNPILLPDHVQSILKKTGENTYTWEMRITVYDESFNENNSSNFPVNLSLNKELGFTIGYCDNDETTVREHFILSQEGQGDTGWINSEKFGTLKLVGNTSTPKFEDVSHAPLQPTSSDVISITTEVTSESAITSVVLKWGRTANDLGNVETMISSSERYMANIPAQTDKTTIYYEIEVENEHGVKVVSDVYSFLVSDEQFGFYADYDVSDIGFNGFGGSTFAEVENPFIDAGNNSNKVGKSKQGFETWAGIYSEVLKSIDFVSTPIFKMKVYGPKAGDILVKFEDELDQTVFYDLSIPLSQTNQWTEITIDFSAAPSGVYEKLVLFFDYGNGTEDTYYFDDIRLESIVTSSFNEGVQSDVTFSPNPATTQLRFSKTHDWIIYSLTGELMLEGTSSEVSIESLKPGVYLIQLGTKTQRLIVN